MQFSYTILTAFVLSIAYGQSIPDLVSQIPSCALVCLATAATAAGCGLTDYACQCGTAKDSITASASPCIASGCSSTDASKVLTISGEICAAVAAPAGSSSATTPTTTPTGSLAPSLATSSTTSSTTTSAPATFTGDAGSRLQAGLGVMGAGAVMLVALGV